MNTAKFFCSNSKKNCKILQYFFSGNVPLDTYKCVHRYQAKRFAHEWNNSYLYINCQTISNTFSPKMFVCRNRSHFWEHQSKHFGLKAEEVPVFILFLEYIFSPKFPSVHVEFSFEKTSENFNLLKVRKNFKIIHFANAFHRKCSSEKAEMTSEITSWTISLKPKKMKFYFFRTVFRKSSSEHIEDSFWKTSCRRLPPVTASSTPLNTMDKTRAHKGTRCPYSMIKLIKLLLKNSLDKFPPLSFL